MQCDFSLVPAVGLVIDRIRRKWLHWYCFPPNADISVARRWCRQFTEGRTKVHNEERSGRPSLVTPGLMESVQQEILQNWRFAISELSGQFLQMSCSLLYEIVFRYRKTFPQRRWSTGGSDFMAADVDGRLRWHRHTNVDACTVHKQVVLNRH